MRLSVKTKVSDLKITFAGGGALGDEERARSFAVMAKKEIDLVDRANDAIMGRDVKYKTYVDGKPSPSLKEVTTTSQIVAEWELGIGVIEYIWDLLGRVGPVRKGKYRESRMMFADGVRIDSPNKAAGAKEVVFVPTVPYARKIERGQKGYRPGAVYESVAAMAKTRFNNIAKVKFTYAEPPTSNTDLDKWALGNATQTVTKSNKLASKYARNRRNPAILVYL
jgi:hypothetical protein